MTTRQPLRPRRSIRRCLAAAAAACVLLAATPWLLAQPDADARDRVEERPARAPGHAGQGRSITDDAFSERPDQAGDDRGPRRGGPGSFRERRDQMAGQFEDVLAVLDDLDPRMADRLRNAGDERPGLRMMAIQRHFPEVTRLVRLRNDDPEMYDLRVRDLRLFKRSVVLATEARSAAEEGDDNAADDLTDTLDDVVEEHFDVQQEIRALELERLEARIEALKDAHDERDRNKRDLIEQRTQRLLEGKDLPRFPGLREERRQRGEGSPKRRRDSGQTQEYQYEGH